MQRAPLVMQLPRQCVSMNDHMQHYIQHYVHVLFFTLNSLFPLNGYHSDARIPAMIESESALPWYVARKPHRL